MTEPTPTSGSGDASALPLQPEVPVEADDNIVGDGDSALDVQDNASSTTSIRSSILKHREENGRRYHAYKEGSYLLPNDEVESDRLDLQHHLFYLTYNGRAHICPIPKAKQLNRVLDVGTGTGIWALDFADEHPETEVIGVDLSPIQPSFVPPNVTFEIDDLEDTWTFTQKFDFIHSRMMTGSFTNWPRFFEQAYDNLNPGGYIEVVDNVLPVRSDDNTFPPDSAFLKWTQMVGDGFKEAGRPITSALSYASQMRAAGFENVTETRYKWPQNRWPKDPKMKELGMWTHANVASDLAGMSLAIFTRIYKWTAEELELFLVDVRKEMRDPRIHAYFLIIVVHGQKPGSASTSAPPATAASPPPTSS